MGALFRLAAPLSLIPQISTTRTVAQGGACEGKSTFDLVLVFEQEPSAWLEGLSELKKQMKSNDSKNAVTLCEVVARPFDVSKTEIRLSYFSKNAGGDAHLKMLSYQTNVSFLIDHWIETKGSADKGPKKSKPLVVKEKQPKKQGTPSSGEVSNSINIFDDDSQWDRLLGADATAFDLNTSELDRFRYFEKSAMPSAKNEEIERQTLRLPFFELPSLEQALEFIEDPFQYSDFGKDDIEAFRSNTLKADQERNLEIVLKGMNFVQSLARKSEWLRAQRALDILERSAQENLLPVNNGRWWALKGHIFYRLSRELSNSDFLRKALDMWREGARRAAGSGGESHSMAEYMVVQLIRTFFNEKLYYAAAEALTWAKKYSWSPRIEERFAFLRGEALYKLGLNSDASEEFSRFYKLREDRPLNASIDRRLVPAAAFRIGDIEYRSRNFNEAATAYSKVLLGVPTISKFSFEGNWYPDEVRVFPQVLAQRAESFVQLGFYQQALKDLRGFVYIAPNHPRIGNILYRIGDLLNVVGAPQDRVLNAWRECVFRVPGTLGAKLCEARKSAAELVSTSDKVKWPRLIGAIEDAKPTGSGDSPLSFWQGVRRDNLETYVDLILADAFIKHGEARQALMRLDPAFKLSPDPGLAMWLQEYTLTAFAGSLSQLYAQGRFKEIISDYDVRRKTLLYRQTRPEILWYVSKAYAALGLPELAEGVLAEAERIKKIIARVEPRPFESLESDWKKFRATLEIELFEASKRKEASVEAALGQLDPAAPDTIRLRIRYFAAAAKAKEEVLAWKDLAKKEFLSWPELKRYSEVLKKTEQDNERLNVLEKTAGIWLAEREKVGRDKGPPADLLMDLADLRAQQKNRTLAALAVYDFLLTIDTSKLGPVVTPAMIEYRRAQLYKTMGRNDDARRGFEKAKRLDPDGIWGRLAASAQKELTPPTAAQ